VGVRGDFGEGELCTATVGAQDLVSSDEEATTDQRGGALVAEEAVVVPVASLERYELRRSQSSNGPHAAATFLGEHLSEAVCTERFLVT